MAKTVGRAVLLDFWVAKPDADPAGATWLRLGAMDQKSIKWDWSTADATADDSPDLTEETLVTFKKVTISGSGISKFDTASNQEAFEAQVTTPGASTDYQPHAWVRMTYPNGKKYTGPFLFTSFSIDAANSDAVKFSTEGTSAGAVTRTPAP